MKRRINQELAKLFKTNKYNADTTKCGQGHKHQSIFESNYCDALSVLVKTGGIKSYEIQKKFDLIVNGIKICSHYVDFWVEHKGGEFECHETKGAEMSTWKLKYKLFKAIFPEIKYIIVK